MQADLLTRIVNLLIKLNPISGAPWSTRVKLGAAMQLVVSNSSLTQVVRRSGTAVGTSTNCCSAFRDRACKTHTGVLHAHRLRACCTAPPPSSRRSGRLSFPQACLRVFSLLARSLMLFSVAIKGSIGPFSSREVPPFSWGSSVLARFLRSREVSCFSPSVANCGGLFFSQFLVQSATCRTKMNFLSNISVACRVVFFNHVTGVCTLALNPEYCCQAKDLMCQLLQQQNLKSRSYYYPVSGGGIYW